MSQTVSVDQMADAILKGLEEYNDLAADEMKKAVRKSARLVKTEINGSAPVRTGRYAKSWTTKATKESDHSLEVTVYSP